MVLAEAILNQKNGRMLLNYGTILTKQIIDLLIERGINEVSILDKHTLIVEPKEIIKKELATLISEEIKRLAPDDIDANTCDKMVEVSKHTRKLVHKILEDETIINACVEMKILDSIFLFPHSITSCALSLLVAGAMDINEQEMIKIGKGALLHDLGLCEMPMLLRGNPEGKQKEAMWKEHSTYGYYFAKQSGISEEISKMILHHHEFWNGDGFPKKIKGEDIPIGSRIISVCETYDRLIKQDKYPRYQAIEYLYGAGNYYFDSKVVQAFTNNLSVYPLGSLVRLTTGEVGVVVNVRKNLGPRPIVQIYYNRVNKPLSNPRHIDLGEERTIFIESIL